MKPQKLLLFSLGLAAFAAGCNPATDDKSAADPLNKLKTDTREIARDVQEYSFAQKAQFTDAMRVQMVEIRAELDRLAARIEKSAGATRDEAKPKFQALRTQTETLTGQLDGVRDATESTWTDVKTGFRTGLLQLKDGFQQARQWTSEKIAP